LLGKTGGGSGTVRLVDLHAAATLAFPLVVSAANAALLPAAEAETRGSSNLHSYETVSSHRTHFSNENYLDVGELDLVAIGQEGVEPEDELVVPTEEARHAANHPGGVDGHRLQQAASQDNKKPIKPGR